VRQLGEADRGSRHADDADTAVAEFEVGRCEFHISLVAGPTGKMRLRVVSFSASHDHLVERAAYREKEPDRGLVSNDLRDPGGMEQKGGGVGDA
jgi:hypothetical protein